MYKINFFLALAISINIYANNDYENFEFSSPINPWNVQSQYIAEFDKVKCLEFGYRGALGGKLFIDANYYYNWYTNFIGFITGAEIYVDALGLEILDVYRVATNSEKIITTQGLSTGLNYYLDNQFTFNGNYSWNVLNKQNDDPIIPAYNTPEHKFNLGFSGKEIDLKMFDKSLLKKISFNLNYKWVKGFEFEALKKRDNEMHREKKGRS